MDERIQTYFLGELSQSERLELLKDVEMNQTLKSEFIEIQNIRALSNLSSKGENRLLGKRSYERFAQQKRTQKIHRQIVRMIGYAAMIAVLIASSSLLTIRLTQSDFDITSTNSLFVPAGQRAQLTLQDGTKVWLNAKTTLTYPAHFNGKNRKVTIEGEAYFDVAKDPSKPFIVSAGNVEMKVLGTKFNVYSYPEAGFIQTSLIEGSVKVLNTRFPADGVILKPNEQVTVRGNKMVVEKITFPDHFLWKDGIYCFEREALSSIVKKLEIYYDIQIIIQNPALFDEEYTGKFRQSDSIDDILRILLQIRDFKIEKDRERNIITLKK